jgi:hypothetical protein
MEPNNKNDIRLQALKALQVIENTECPIDNVEIKNLLLYIISITNNGKLKEYTASHLTNLFNLLNFLMEDSNNSKLKKNCIFNTDVRGFFIRHTKFEYIKCYKKLFEKDTSITNFEILKRDYYEHIKNK